MLAALIILGVIYGLAAVMAYCFISANLRGGVSPSGKEQP